MLINKENEVFLFDRDNSVFHVKGFRFPRKKDPSQHLVNTLIDGVSQNNTIFFNSEHETHQNGTNKFDLFQEMVIDKVNGQSVPRYLCYDIIKIDGQDVGKLAFYPVRLRCIEDEVIGPR